MSGGRIPSSSPQPAASPMPALIAGESQWHVCSATARIQIGNRVWLAGYAALQSLVVRKDGVMHCRGFVSLS